MHSVCVLAAALAVALAGGAGVRAAPVAGGCDPNSAPAGPHCVCKPSTLCKGSRCSHAHQLTDGAVGGVGRSGYVSAGDKACSDCSCELAGAAAPGPADAAAPARAPVAVPGQGINAFFGVKSAPAGKYIARRATWRKSGCAEKYAAAGISFKFVIGVPMEPRHVLTNHDQGSKDTQSERDMAKALLAESDQFGDIHFINYRDQYMDLTNKLLGIFKYGFYHTTADYIGEHDDEYCLNPETLKKMIDGHNRAKPGQELYGGNYLWKGDEYKAMVGVAGMVSPYMSGWCSFLSRKIIGHIVDDDWAHTVLANQYGTQADDANTGKWVAYAQEHHGVDVDFRSDRGVITDAEKIVKDMGGR